jgi:hypothetical protein
MHKANYKSPNYKNYRIALLIGIILIIPLGYSVRFATGLGMPLLQDITGSLAYQILLMLLVAFFCPRASLVKVAVWVCGHPVWASCSNSGSLRFYKLFALLG